jgi:MoaA/NifB/PqqE/SkfB family radical SAM enzyme
MELLKNWQMKLMNWVILNLIYKVESFLLQPKKLFQVLEAIKPERFYMYLTTNGYYLDEKMAKKLAEYKVSRVSVSIDSMDEKIHDEIRGRKESWKRAIAALEHVQKCRNGSLFKYYCRTLQCKYRTF